MFTTKESRSFWGFVVLVAFVVGMYTWTQVQPMPEYRGNMSRLLLAFYNTLSHVWVISVPIYLVAMIFRVKNQKTNLIGGVGAICWATIFILSTLNAFNYTGAHIYSSMELLLLGALVFVPVPFIWGDIHSKLED